MSLFIKKLKKRDYHYLQKSIIFVKSNTVKRMLDIIFMLQPPVAPVYIISNQDNIPYILEDNIDNIRENIITILPSKSLFKFI